MPSATVPTVRVADEVWIATALLHREHPHRSDFTVQEIVARARREALALPFRPGVYQHAIAHAVANRPPSPNRYRLLFATGPKTRRLYRPGDPGDPRREGGKTVPHVEDLPKSYRDLVAWYLGTYSIENSLAERIKNDPILALSGLGKELWADESPDEYVRRLRQGWG